jgi:hypothetical protein
MARSEATRRARVIDVQAGLPSMRMFLAVQRHDRGRDGRLAAAKEISAGLTAGVIQICGDPV